MCSLPQLGAAQASNLHNFMYVNTDINLMCSSGSAGAG